MGYSSVSNYLRRQTAALNENERRKKIKTIKRASMDYIHHMHARKLLLTGGRYDLDNCERAVNGSDSELNIREQLVLYEISQAVKDGMPIILIHNNEDLVSVLSDKFGNRTLIVGDGTFDPFLHLTNTEVNELCSDEMIRRGGELYGAGSYIGVMQDIIGLDGDEISLSSIIQHPLLDLGDSVDDLAHSKKANSGEKVILQKALKNSQGNANAVSELFRDLNRYFNTGSDTKSLSFDDIIEEGKILCMSCEDTEQYAASSVNIVLSAINKKIKSGKDVLVVFESVRTEDFPMIEKYAANGSKRRRWIFSANSVMDAVNNNESQFRQWVQRSDVSILFALGGTNDGEIEMWSSISGSYRKIIPQMTTGTQRNRYSALSESGNEAFTQQIEINRRLEACDIADMHNNQVYIFKSGSDLIINVAALSKE